MAAQPRASRTRSGRRSARCSCTRRERPPAGRCRGRSRPSTTGRCAGCCGSRRGDAEFETAKVERAHRQRRPHRPRRRARAADRRRARLAARARRRATTSSRPTRRSRAAWRCIRTAPATTSSCGSTRATSAPGYGWSFPARDELRIGVGSFDPRAHVKEPTLPLAADVEADAVRFQGNWIPHRLRPATEDGVFFVGDSAGHCLPLTAEGIRTALYFGVACGRELRAVLEGRQDLAAALRRYHDFSAVAPLAVRVHVPRAAVGPAPARAADERASCGCSGAAACRTGRSGTTSTSRRPRRRCRRRLRARSPRRPNVSRAGRLGSVGCLQPALRNANRATAAHHSPPYKPGVRSATSRRSPRPACRRAGRAPPRAGSGPG